MPKPDWKITVIGYLVMFLGGLLAMGFNAGVSP